MRNDTGIEDKSEIFIVWCMLLPVYSLSPWWPVFLLVSHTNIQTLHDIADLLSTWTSLCTHPSICVYSVCWTHPENGSYPLSYTLMSPSPPPPLWQCSLSMMKPLLVPLWNPCVGMTLRVLCVLCLCVCYSGWPPQPFVPIDFADADGERSSKGGSGWACGGSGGWQPGPLAYGGKRRGRRSGQWGLKLGSTLLSSFAEGQAGLLDVWARNGRPQSPRPSTGLPERPPTAPQLQRKCEWLAWSLISDLFDLYANCQPSYLFLSG